MANKNHLNIHLYVIPVCNLKCKHCYYDATSGILSDKDLLSISQMQYIITSLSNKYFAAFDIEGGEFFFRDDIDKIFEGIKVHYWNNVTITSNGTIPIKTDPKYLRCLDEFRISVEGHTDKLQKDIRGINLKSVIGNCLNIQSNKVPITLRITLHKKNYNSLLEMVNYYTELGITRFSFYEFQAVGRGIRYSNEYNLSQIDIEAVLQSLTSKKLKKEKIKLLKLSFCSKRVTTVNTYKDILLNNGFKILPLTGIPSLTINYDGRIGICPWNIGHDTIGIFNKEYFIKDISRYLEMGLLEHTCQHCSAIRVVYNSNEK